eukprot:10510551-Lingulodinium_polyedra.AAC.1
MSVSAVATGDGNLANIYWLEPTPAPAPAPLAYAYPTYQVAPAPVAGSQWGYGTLWVADAQW